MVFRAVVRNYDSRSRTGTVELDSLKTVNVKNYIYPSDNPSEDIVNGFLTDQDKNTVLPSHDFFSGSVVAVYKDIFDSYFILGNIIGQTTSTTTTLAPANLYKLGRFEFDILKETDTSGNVYINPFAKRALVRKVKITKLDGGPFIVKLFNDVNQLQASWGDGEVILEDELIDDAGLFFEAEDYMAVINLNPTGLYKIYFLGERFS
jgi:hypothetical protein